MRTSLDDEQELLVHTIRQACVDAGLPGSLRDLEGREPGFPEELWAALVAIGVPGFLVDEARGGSAAGVLALALVAEEVGASAADPPLVASAAVATALLAAAPRRADIDDRLRRLASGDTVVVPAWLEPGGVTDPIARSVTVESHAGGLRVRGRKVHVPHARTASELLVTAAGPEGTELLLVPTDAPGVWIERTATISNDPIHLVDLDTVVDESARVVAPSDTPALWAAAEPVGQVIAAAVDCGTARASLEMATAYARERVQFGRPIGSFQALAHELVDATVLARGATLVTRGAAWALDRGRPAAALAATARLRAGDAAGQATRVGQQVLGGIGFTTDVDMQLHFRRAIARRLLWWEPAGLRRRIASGTLDGDDPTLLDSLDRRARDDARPATTAVEDT